MNIMIVFQTKHLQVYNYIIHNLLDIEMFTSLDGNDEENISYMIEIFLPKYLHREQHIKCLEIFKDIYNRTEDSFFHDMTAFHEVALYYFIIYLIDLQENEPNFNKMHFNKESKNIIKLASKEDYAELNAEERKETTLKDIQNEYYNLRSYTDILFVDTDFLILDSLYNYRRGGELFLEKRLGINIDYYYELLPLDLQKKFKSKHITLRSEIRELLIFIQNRIDNGNLAKLFWEKDNPINENKIQIIFENLMEAYFNNQNVEINREVLIGNGKVDFKIYKSNNKEEKVLIELKKASSPQLKNGLKNQLTQYLKSSSYIDAFYFIICYTEEEFNKVSEFINNNVYTSTYELYISVYILDVRIKKTASKLTSND